MLTVFIVTVAMSISGLLFGQHLAGVLNQETKDIKHPIVYKIVPRKFSVKELTIGDLVTILFGAVLFTTLIVIVAVVESGREKWFSMVFAPYGTCTSFAAPGRTPPFDNTS